MALQGKLQFKRCQANKSYVKVTSRGIFPSGMYSKAAVILLGWTPSRRNSSRMLKKLP
jgi:hypothetical protein